MSKLKQTIRYQISKHDEDASAWAWRDWLSSLVRYAGGEPIKDSFKIAPQCDDRHCQIDFYADACFTSETFPVQPLDANLKDLEVTFPQQAVFSQAEDCSE